MVDALWTLGALTAAAVIGHYPIAWIVNNLYRGLGWPNEGASKRLPALVGSVERALFVAAMLYKQPEFIAVWLALKVAGQWQGWSEGKPNHVPPINGRDLFNVFLIGSGISIGYSVLAVFLMRWGMSGQWPTFGLASGVALVATIIFGVLAGRPFGQVGKAGASVTR